MSMGASVWPWLAVAAAGALHGLNPLSGWAVLACARGAGALHGAMPLLLAIAAGHVAAVLVIAAAVPLLLQRGWTFAPWAPQAGAACLLLAMALHHLGGGMPRAGAALRGRLALALASGIAGLGHGAGWMLLPALASLCVGAVPGREITASGSLLLGLAAVAVHLAAMLATTATTAAMAAGAYRVVEAVRRRLAGRQAGVVAGRAR
jgi:hypothetical protein